MFLGRHNARALTCLHGQVRREDREDRGSSEEDGQPLPDPHDSDEVTSWNYYIFGFVVRPLARWVFDPLNVKHVGPDDHFVHERLPLVVEHEEVVLNDCCWIDEFVVGADHSSESMVVDLFREHQTMASSRSRAAEHLE